MKPLGNKIQLDIKEVKIGAIQSDSIEEHGTIIALGPEVTDCISTYDEKTKKVETVDLFKVGQTLYFKAWAIDVITEDQTKYYFISADSDAICAVSENVL